MKQNQKVYEKFRSEALRRLKLLNVMPDVKRRLQAEGHQTYWSMPSRWPTITGVLYWDDNDSDDLDKSVKNTLEKFHLEHPNILVYHSIWTPVQAGGEQMQLLTILCITEEDLKDPDFEQQPDGSFYTFCYTANLTYPDLSEFGYCCVKGAGGGVVLVL